VEVLRGINLEQAVLFIDNNPDLHEFDYDPPISIFPAFHTDLRIQTRE
jgi:hypothetical protein